MTDTPHSLADALWRIYRRTERPAPWSEGGNLPWNDPVFSERMLREHLDESHGAASRTTPERTLVLDWLWRALDLQPGKRLLDVTCGPGLYAVELARRGCEVVGVDFGPAAIAHARDLARSQGVSDRCTFIESDARDMDFGQAEFDAALFIYGQLAVFKREEAQDLLTRVAQALKPGDKLVVELLDQNKVDKADTTWWFTDDKGLWGEKPFLHLGERFWNEAEQISTERFYIIHLDTGQLDQVMLCDQTYSVETMTEMMRQAGFSAVQVYSAWGGLPLYDAGEWVVYVANR